MLWWHKYILRHTITIKRVSVPLYDIFSKGELLDCSCGEEWVK